MNTKHLQNVFAERRSRIYAFCVHNESEHVELVYRDCKWKLPSLSELTTIIFNMELTHLGSKASNIPLQVPKAYIVNLGYNKDKWVNFQSITTKANEII